MGRTVGRTVAVYTFPAALVALGWMRLEEPRAAGAAWFWLVLLALVPALAPRLWMRLALVVPAALLAARIALGKPTLEDRYGFLGPVVDRFGDGIAGFYDYTVPFGAIEHPRMHGVVLLAIFGFCLVLGQSIAARRPLPALLAVIAGAGWPAALYPARSVLYGAIILAAALWVLAGLRTTRPVPALLAGAALVLVAAGFSSSAALAKDGVLSWRTWDPSGVSRDPVSVRFVWDANYRGIEFAKERTTVLRIRGPKRGLYWRATTLDGFDSDSWFENPTPLSTGPADGSLPEDPLLPARARNRNTWVRQDVEVVALRDSRVVAAAQPVALDGPQLGTVFRLSDGIVQVQNGLQQGQGYTVYSYAPRPEPAELASLPAEYPPELGRFLDIGRTRVDPFGAPGRDALVAGLFQDERYLGLWPYEAMWEQALQLRADARSPYGAVIAIETWLRSTGGFSYDESPPRSSAPPLASFVAEGKRGYCQHFAGAMALMLRMLGVPARVAAGFTSGKYEDGGWTVTDHNAHAWVEVWFPGYGWLPFDPTPGRGSLTAGYSASSTGFNAGDAAEAFGASSGAQARGGGADQLRLLEQKERQAERAAAGRPAEDGSTSRAWFLVLAVLAAALAIGAVKIVRRRLRYLTRDPRLLAGAARRELADFLADQGIAIEPSATAEDLRALLRRELQTDAGAFARALADARFGPPSASAAGATLARKELRKLLHVLRHRLGRTARLRGFVALRSLRS